MSRARYWVLDSCLALVFLVGGQLEASVATTDGFTGGPLFASRLVAASVALALVLRRTAPRTCLVLCSLGMILPSLFWSHDLYFWTELLPLLFAVYPVARHVDGWQGQWGWVLAFVAADSVFLHSPGAREWSNVVFLVFMLGTTTLAGRLVRRGVETRRRLSETLARLADEQRATEEAAVRTERARIAAEVQDVVAHAVGSMLVQVGAARLAMEGAGLVVPEQLRAAEVTGRRALAELRSSIGTYGPSDAPAPLEPLPDLAHLSELVRGFRSAGLDVRLTGAPPVDLEALPPGLQLNAYRILQEALTNALRHAGRVLVHVHLGLEDGGLVLEVGNPTARGTRPPGLPSGGHGLVGMRERVAMFDGHLETAVVDDTFVVHAVFPLPTADLAQQRARATVAP